MGKIEHDLLVVGDVSECDSTVLEDISNFAQENGLNGIRFDVTPDSEMYKLLKSSDHYTEENGLIFMIYDIDASINTNLVECIRADFDTF